MGARSNFKFAGEKEIFKMSKRYKGFTTGYPEKLPIVWSKREILEAYVFCVCLAVAGLLTIVGIIIFNH